MRYNSMPICESGYTLEVMRVCDPICHNEYQCIPQTFPVFVLKRAFTTILVFLIVVAMMCIALCSGSGMQGILLLFLSIVIFLNSMELGSME
jgi:hypothetical protein